MIYKARFICKSSVIALLQLVKGLKPMPFLNPKFKVFSLGSRNAMF